MTRKRRPFWRIFWVALLLLVVGLGFWASHDMSPDLARLERILALLERDADLLWRQRSDLDTTFEGAGVLTDGDGFRLVSSASDYPAGGPEPKIVCMGASPTFGYGVAAQEAYPHLTEALLQEQRPGAQVLNAGQIGFSSWQGRRLFEAYIDAWAPDLLTVSYVVNDIDRWRFYGSDGKSDDDTEPPSAFGAWMSSAVNGFAPTAWLIRHRNRILAKLFAGVSQRARYELAHVRSSAESYERNLRWFRQECQSRGLPLVFIKMPFRLPYAVPDADPRMASQLENAARLLDEEKVSDAMALIQEALTWDAEGSRVHYLHGRLLEIAGDDEAAREAYAKATHNVIHDCARDARTYNAILERVARETGTPLVDPTKALGADQADMALFLPGDYIHPNVEGHERIAACLTSAVRRVLDGDATGFVETCR